MGQISKSADQSLEIKLERTKVKPKQRWKRYKAYGPMFLMIIPGMIYLLINNYLPMFGLLLAFKDMNFTNGLLGGDWVGFRNFEFLFKTKSAYIITRNTILYNVVFIVTTNVAAIGIAILLNEIRHKFFKGLYQSLLLLPHLMSMVVVSYLVYAFLGVNGFMNQTVLPLLGLDSVSWYMNSNVWPFILPIVNIWKGAGFACVLYLATLVGIDKHYYEAAKLDGASKFQQIRLITLPLLKPVIILLVILAIGGMFRSEFGLFYQVPMNSGAIYSTTNVIDTYVFRGLLQLGDVGMSAAAGFYQSIVGFILILVSNFIIRKVNKENALF